MKKIFTLFSLLSVAGVANSQALLVEDFNYSGALTANGWSAHSGGGTNPISTTTGLTYAGYANSGIGNAALVNNLGGEDDNIGLTAEVSGNGSTVYMSAMVNVTETADKAGDYFLHLGDRVSPASFTTFAARVFVKTSGTNVNFGISNTSTPTWGTTNFAKNTTYLLVVKYTINTGGADEVILWVLPSGVPTTEAGLGTAELTVSTTSGTDVIDAVALRQGSGTNSVQVVVDGIRVASNYSNAPLPVQLTSFSATLSDSKVNVNWTTANEVNVAGYEIERSVNGKDFMPMSLVQAENSGATKQYSYTDAKAVAGLSYYRLKMNDKDGSYKYSQIATIKNSIVGVSLYPNPVRSAVTVQHESAVNGATVAIIGMNGKQVASVNVQAGAVQTMIDASKLAPGAYMVVYTNNGQKQTKQFIKE